MTKKHDYQHRKYLLSTYGQRYKKHYIDEGGCFYCGDDFEVWDHCPPLAWVESLTNREWKKRKVPFILLPSCADCNRKLGDKPHMNVLDRLYFLENRLTKIIEKGLALWSDEELEEMSPMFQRQIKAKQDEIRFLAARLHGIQTRILDTDSFPVFGA